MLGFLNIGYGNYIQLSKLNAIINPDSAPIKRLVQDNRDTLNLINATNGRKTRSVLIMENKQIILSAIQAETLKQRVVEMRDEGSI